MAMGRRVAKRIARNAVRQDVLMITSIGSASAQYTGRRHRLVAVCGWTPRRRRNACGPGAATGLYGELSYNGSERRREIGIGAALGATRSRLIRLVLRQGLGFTLAGLTLGLMAAATFLPVARVSHDRILRLHRDW
jgi:hypothetical protein